MGEQALVFQKRTTIPGQITNMGVLSSSTRMPIHIAVYQDPKHHKQSEVSYKIKWPHEVRHQVVVNDTTHVAWGSLDGRPTMA